MFSRLCGIHVYTVSSSVHTDAKYLFNDSDICASSDILFYFSFFRGSTASFVWLIICIEWYGVFFDYFLLYFLYCSNFFLHFSSNFYVFGGHLCFLTNISLPGISFWQFSLLSWLIMVVTAFCVNSYCETEIQSNHDSYFQVFHFCLCFASYLWKLWKIHFPLLLKL